MARTGGNAEEIKRHYVEGHGALELCLWGIDKHALLLDLQMPVKHLEIDVRMS